MGEGDHNSAHSCRMGEVEGVGTVELVCVGILLRMSCDSFIMPMCGSVGSGEPGSRLATMGTFCWEPIGEGEAATKSLIM